MSYAWEVWKANLGLLVGITACVGVINSFFGGMQSGIETAFEQQGHEEVGLIVGLGISFTSSLVQIFLGIGQTQIVLKLLRREPADFAELFGGGPLFLQVLGASILAGIALVIGFVALIIPGIVLAILFWPFYWLIVDEKSKVIQSFGMAVQLGQANVGTTIVLWLASFGIIVLGLMACCVGLLFAAPLVTVIWGAAYLMMSGQLK
jgi:uncharacterized membrane protein